MHISATRRHMMAESILALFRLGCENDMSCGPRNAPTNS